MKQIIAGKNPNLTKGAPLRYQLWESGCGWRIFRVFSPKSGTAYFVTRCVYKTGIERMRFYDMNSALAYCGVKPD